MEIIIKSSTMLYYLSDQIVDLGNLCRATFNLKNPLNINFIFIMHGNSRRKADDWVSSDVSTT